MGASDEAARDDVESDVVVVSEPTAPPSAVTQRPAKEWNVVPSPRCGEAVRRLR